MTLPERTAENREENSISNGMAVCAGVLDNFSSAVWNELTNDWNNDRTSMMARAGTSVVLGVGATLLCRKFPTVLAPTLAIAGTGTLAFGAAQVGSFFGESMSASSVQSREELIARGTASLGKAGAFAIETMPGALLGSGLTLKAAGRFNWLSNSNQQVELQAALLGRTTAPAELVAAEIKPLTQPQLCVKQGTMKSELSVTAGVPSKATQQLALTSEQGATAGLEASTTVPANTVQALHGEPLSSLRQEASATVPVPVPAKAAPELSLNGNRIVPTRLEQIPPPEFAVYNNRRIEDKRGNFYRASTAERYFDDLPVDPMHPNPMLARFELAVQRGQLEKYKHAFTAHYAHALPTEEGLAFIGKHGPVVELGAGNGYWSALLKNRKVDTIAYDCWEGYTYSPAATWTEVLTGDAKMLAKHPDRTLFISWPSNGAASDALIHFRGNRFVYLGELDSDIMGDSMFFKMLERDWKQIESMPIPKLSGYTQDQLYYYERKTRPEKLLERHRARLALRE